MKNKIDKLHKTLSKIEKKAKKLSKKNENIFDTDFIHLNGGFVKEYRLAYTKIINYADDNKTIIDETIQKSVIFELDTTDENLAKFCKENNIDEDTKVVVLNEKFVFTEAHLKSLLKQLKHFNDKPVFDDKPHQDTRQVVDED